ncbi:type I-E CRISPR-associated protein Cse1/CasA [Methylocystis echinoides]|uniref:Type I-E CRISPR-associated protein Cse1/CasA n=1 Tax=Methylocystis echinoides TaxID=29468 RepID=A0A9W6LSG3_9HYPH|nr:type I-E CRISPR-associated protein Cse1/CasA [Methylocystis echinoides]GLI93426.1 type I-E CRISPR-associated protein Cse1/CasA [Methylocystis echinoides]
MAPFSLLASPWLPVRRRGGSRCLIRPAEIAADFSRDPIVAFAWGRPDFDAASREFMIGLLATAFAPADGRAFLTFWHDPPDAVQLDAAFTPFARAFLLDDNGPRFAQDHDPLTDAEETPVSALLIEAPGANTIKENKDLFQKRGQIEHLSRAAAAMALFTLQCYAPSGGAGHRVSLRGGGPLTTLVAPSDATPELWRLLWLNTLQSRRDYPPAQEALDRIFPWLAPTITSEGKPPATVSPRGSHILQAFWGMPRRIRLVFAPNSDGRACPITGVVDDVSVTGFRTRPYGVSYHESFEHPLSPYYSPKGKGDWLPVHPQPGGILYRDWPAVAGAPDEKERLAAIVAGATTRLRALGDFGEARLLASGFDMDNMKARGFVETEMPVFLFAETVAEEDAEIFQQAARSFVEAAELAASAMGIAIRTALAGARADGKATPFSALRENFFLSTQDPFFDTLRELSHRFAAGEDPELLRASLGEKWLGALRKTSVSTFDSHVDPLDLPQHVMERAVDARGHLVGAFFGHGALGRKIDAALGRAREPQKKSRKAGKAA